MRIRNSRNLFLFFHIKSLLALPRVIIPDCLQCVQRKKYSHYLKKKTITNESMENNSQKVVGSARAKRLFRGVFRKFWARFSQQVTHGKPGGEVVTSGEFTVGNIVKYELTNNVNHVFGPFL